MTSGHSSPNVKPSNWAMYPSWMTRSRPIPYLTAGVVANTSVTRKYFSSAGSTSNLSISMVVMNPDPFICLSATRQWRSWRLNANNVGCSPASAMARAALSNFESSGLGSFNVLVWIGTRFRICNSDKVVSHRTTSGRASQRRPSPTRVWSLFAPSRTPTCHRRSPGHLSPGLQSTGAAIESCRRASRGRDPRCNHRGRSHSIASGRWLSCCRPPTPPWPCGSYKSSPG